MSEKPQNSAGLRGQVAGQTSLCTVGKTGAGLTYRGYEITDLAENAQFEEVAYLLLRGKLPNRQELDAYVDKPAAQCWATLKRKTTSASRTTRSTACWQRFRALFAIGIAMPMTA